MPTQTSQRLCVCVCARSDTSASLSLSLSLSPSLSRARGARAHYPSIHRACVCVRACVIVCVCVRVCVLSCAGLFPTDRLPLTGWQLVLSSSNISDLLIPTNRVSVSYWNVAEARSSSEPPAHIEPTLRSLLAPDRSGCVSATTVQRLVEKSASAAAVNALKSDGQDPTTKKSKKKPRRKKRRSEPLLVKLQQRAERMSQLVLMLPVLLATRPQWFHANRLLLAWNCM